MSLACPARRGFRSRRGWAARTPGRMTGAACSGRARAPPVRRTPHGVVCARIRLHQKPNQQADSAEHQRRHRRDDRQHPPLLSDNRFRLRFARQRVGRHRVDGGRLAATECPRRRAAESARCAVSVVGILGHAAGDDVVESGGHQGIRVTRPRWREGDVCRDQMLQTVTGEGHFAGERLVEHAGE